MGLVMEARGTGSRPHVPLSPSGAASSLTFILPHLKDGTMIPQVFTLFYKYEQGWTLLTGLLAR